MIAPTPLHLCPVEWERDVPHAFMFDGNGVPVPVLFQGARMEIVISPTFRRGVYVAHPVGERGGLRVRDALYLPEGEALTVEHAVALLRVKAAVRTIGEALRAIGRAWHDDRVTLPDADCRCHACLDAHQTPLERMQRGMVVCRTCGNKRCPKASDHRHACTGSNDPGQAGSVYGPAMGVP